jgi:hypothetical protein
MFFVVEGFLGLGKNTEALSAAAKARFVVCATVAALFVSPQAFFTQSMYLEPHKLELSAGHRS